MGRAVFSFAGISPPTDMRGVNAYPLAAIKSEREQVTKQRQRAIERRDDAKADADDRAEAVKDIADADARLKGLDQAAKELKAGSIS